MKILNIHKVNQLVNAKDLYLFVKKYYPYVDAIEISISTLLDELLARNLLEVPVPFDMYDNTRMDRFYEAVANFFFRIFSNNYFNQKDLEISTPAIVDELFEWITVNHPEHSKESFLDLCHHYSIPIFITDFKIVKDVIFSFIPHEWSLEDKNLKRIIANDYYPYYYYLHSSIERQKEYGLYDHIFGSHDTTITKMHMFAQYCALISVPKESYINHITIQDALLGDLTEILKTQKSNFYRTLYEMGHDLSLYTENSLTYLSDELLG